MKSIAITNASLAQMTARMSFRITVQFLTPLRQIINLGYAEPSRRSGKTTMGMAISQVMSAAVMGCYPDLYVDPAKVQLSKGPLSTVGHTAISIAAEQIKVSLHRDDMLWNGHQDDEVILCAYNPVRDVAWINKNKSRRSDEAVYLEIPPAMFDDELHLYLMVCDRARRKFANSRYLGAWVVKEN